MGEITLDQYKGSNIEKGFITDVQSNQGLDDSIIAKSLAGNFEKGIIDEDLFNKAIEELNSLQGDSKVGTKIPIFANLTLQKGEEGWEVKEEKEEVEKGCNTKKAEETTEEDGEDEEDEEGVVEKAEDEEEEDEEESEETDDDEEEEEESEETDDDEEEEEESGE